MLSCEVVKDAVGMPDDVRDSKMDTEFSCDRVELLEKVVVGA